MAKRMLLATAVLWIAIGTTLGLEIASPTRQAVLLDGQWQLAPLEKAEAVLPLPAQGWKPQQVPAWAPIPDSPDPNKVKYRACWVMRRFDAPADWQGRHVRLEFEAVSRYSKVYVNGQYLGEHYDMESPFSFDVSKALRYGRPNELAVWMTAEQTVKDCSSNCDYDFNRTGVWQSVWLRVYPQVRIDDVFVMTSVRKKEIAARVTLANATAASRRVTPVCEVRDWSPSDGDKPPQSPLVVRLAGEEVELAAGETKVVDLKAKWEHPKLWSPDNPHLYVMTTTASAGDTQDVRHDRFGFREFWIEGTSFVLNGVKVFLPEIWGDLYEQPVGDLSNEKTWGPLCDCKPGFLAAKASGFRVVRLWWAGEGQRLARALDDADETGMMILCQSIALGGGPFDEKPEFWRHLETMVRTGTRRDRNHPSIILWSRTNEGVQGTNNWQHMTQMLRKMELVSREEDPTRYVYESGSGALEGRGEIISLHYPHEAYSDGGFTEFPKAAYWLEDAKEVRSLYLQYGEKTGDKPVAITEAYNIYNAGGPESVYFWIGEEAYGSFLHGGHAGDGFGKFREAVEDVTAESFLGLRASGAAIVAMTGCFHLSTAAVDTRMAKALAPVLAHPRERDGRFFEDDKVRRTFDVHNDLLAGPCEVVFRWSGSNRDSAYHLDGNVTTRAAQIMIPQHGEVKMTLAGGERRKVAVDFVARSIAWGRNFLDCHASPLPYGIHAQVLVNGQTRFAEKYDFSVYKREFPAVSLGTPVTLVDPAGRQSPSSQALDKLQVAHACVKDLSGLKYPETGILVVGQNALAKLEKTDLQTKLTEFTAAGGWVVCLEQEQFPTGCFPVNLRPDTTERSRKATMVQHIDAGHPMLEGLSSEDFRYWRGDHYVTRMNLLKPTEGNFRPVLAYGNTTTPSADRTPLVEVFHGRGGYVVSQMLLVEKFETEPVASRLLANILNYARRRQLQDADCLSGPVALLAPASEAGKRGWLEGLGARVEPVAPATVQDLAAYKVAAVVLGKGFPGTAQTKVLQEWVRQGGRLLVLGLAAETATEGSALCQAETRLGMPKPMSNNLVVKRTSDELTLGLSNADLYWPKPIVARPPFARLQGAAVIDLTQDPLLEKVVLGRGVMLVCQLPLAAERELDVSRRTASILLTNLGVALASHAGTAVGAKETFFPIDIRKACNRGFKDDVAGDGKGGWTDQGNNDMRYFPVGTQVLGGVRFDVIDPARNDGKSCIALKGKPSPYFPAQSIDIPLGGARLDKLYFLHAVRGAAGGRQAAYVVHYADGAYVEIPVRLGMEVRGWWAAPMDLPNAQMAWSGKNDVCPNVVSVYMTAWKNVHPNAGIESLKMVTSGEDGVPILIAVTGAKVSMVPVSTAGTAIHIDAGELRPNPHGTWSYHDGYAPCQDLQDEEGAEFPGGPIYANLWRRLFAVENLYLTWASRGHLSFLWMIDGNRPGRSGWLTMKYQLPPDKVIAGGEIGCKFNYWYHGCEGPAAAVQVSPDNKSWIDVFRFTGHQEGHWTQENPRTGPAEHGQSCRLKNLLPPQAKGWQTLYVRCIVSVPPNCNSGCIQMLREEWGEKDEHYSMDLTLKKRD